MKNINFEFSVGSDVDFEDLVADIGYENNLVALLSQEEGFNNMKIRIYPPKEQEYWEFKLEDLEEIIERAKKHLLELRKKPI